MKFTSQQIIKLLATKHSEDVFVPECKDGPSTGPGGFSRMDAWVMPRSWANSDITCYEVKVTRADFLQDNKWKNYLPCCNYLYFATAPGVVKESELPPEVGLYELAKTGTRLFLRKKAQRHEAHPQQLEQVFRYILMWRAGVGPEAADKSGRARRLEEELAKKQEDRRYGHLLGRRLGEVVRRDIEEVRCENHRLKRTNEELAKIRECIKRVGLDPEFCSSWSFENRLTQLMRGDHAGVLRSVDNAVRDLTRLHEALKECAPPD